MELGEHFHKYPWEVEKEIPLIWLERWECWKTESAKKTVKKK